MTKKLEELFNLESLTKEQEKLRQEEIIKRAEEINNNEETSIAIAEISKALPVIAEIEALGEDELDDLAVKAERAYDDLMDLGMNVEVRYSGRIFEVAGSMLKNAIDAKTAKIDKKLKAIDLQMRKYKIEKDAEPKKANKEQSLGDSEGSLVADRNDILKRLMGK